MLLRRSPEHQPLQFPDPRGSQEFHLGVDENQRGVGNRRSLERRWAGRPPGLVVSSKWWQRIAEVRFSHEVERSFWRALPDTES
jgi:hypothetical protein